MLNRYYVVGEPILYIILAGHGPHETITENPCHISSKEVREAITSKTNVPLYCTFDKAKKQAVNQFSALKNPHRYKIPILEVCALDLSKVEMNTNDNSMWTTSTNVVIHTARLINHQSNSELKRHFPKTYSTFFGSHGDIIDQVKNLLRDYSHPIGSGIFGNKIARGITFHWNRHHEKDADSIVKELSKKTPKEAYDCLMRARESFLKLPKINRDGSFMRRLDFAIAKLMSHMEMQENENKNSKTLSHR